MKLSRMFAGLVLALLIAVQAIGQCGPNGCRSPRQCGPNGYPGAYPQPQYPPVQQYPPSERPMVPVPPSGEIPEAVKQCYHSLVRIRCGQWGGSGTYLGSGMVITCEHVVRGAQGAVQVRFPDGDVVEAAVLAADYGSDVALLELKGHAPAVAKGIAIADTMPSEGQEIFSAGYGKDGPLCVSPGRITSLENFTIAYDPTDGRKRQRPTAEGSGLTEPGDSGGAWLTADGKLLGVVWGGRSKDLEVSATTELGKFLNDACSRWRKPFPKPDTTPSPIVPPAAPSVDLDSIVGRLENIDGKVTAIVQVIGQIDQRVSTLESPRKGKSDAGWLISLLGAASATFLFFKTRG